ncbi:MAG: transcriptional regulator, ArsR family [Deltaproteobacteria bacterium]|nr:transcriptional regulator, ArsR family [Deltaproteobacteria bacterium]
MAKQRIYEQFARIGKALASPARLELLDLLVQGERAVDALAAGTEMSIANASQHLQVLAGARLVESRREAQRVLYRLADPSVEALWQTLRLTGERRLAELDAVAREYLVHRDELEPIGRGELTKRMRAGTVTLIDVRPVEEFSQGHLPGAVSVPLDELRSWAKRAPKRKQVVAYCRGPYCVWALEAVELLADHGISAARLEEGVGEWRAAGLPIETEGSAP